MSFLLPCSKEAKKVMKDKDGSREDLGYLLIIIGYLLFIIGFSIVFPIILLEFIFPILFSQ